MNNMNTESMTRAELLELQEEITRKLKRFRPYRIKERMVTCTSVICDCRDGGGLHGPYLYVSYRATGETKKASVGPKFSATELKLNVPPRPHILDYLKIPDHVYQKMTVEDGDGYISYELNDNEFEERHGVSKRNNEMSLADTYWGNIDAWDRYTADTHVWGDRRMIPVNRWASYGVGTLRGIAVLEGLERKGYYKE